MLNDKLMQHLAKKGKKLDPNEQKAKMDVVKELSDQAGSMMGDRLKGLKKVTVASDSPQGLEKGLDTAKKLMAKGHDNNEHEHDPAKLLEQAEEETGEDLDHDNEEGESQSHKDKIAAMHSKLEGDEEENDHEPDSEQEEQDEIDHMSADEIDAEMHKLMAAKAKLTHRM